MIRATPRSIAATIVAVVSLVAVAASVVLTWSIVGAGGQRYVDPVFTFGGLTLGATYAAVGWIIATRQPDNAIGWVFLLVGASQGIDSFASLAAAQGLVIDPGSVPFAAEWAWIASWAWAPGFTALVTFSILLFPDGHLPSPRWRPVAWMAGLTMAMLTIPSAAITWAYRGVDLATGALHVVGDPIYTVGEQIQTLGILLIPIVAMASIVSMVARFRHSRGIERQQLKWFTFAAIPEIAFVVSSGFFTWPPLLGLIGVIFIAPLLPVAATIAILRYRLFDIDRIVSRTFAYAAVTGVLAVVFTILILLLQTVLSSFTGGQTIAVAASTLVVFALIQPLRRRVQRAVDRRFDRARFDADDTAAAFSRRIRDEVDMATLTADLARTTAGALSPAALAVWVRGMTDEARR